MANPIDDDSALANLQQRTFGRGDSIPLQPDTLWLLGQGVARTLTWSEEGTLIVLGYWGIGDVVGRPLSQLDPYEIKCLTNVEVNMLPQNLWYQRHLQK
jgi:CRP-like cAMP-binding protein